MQIALPETDVFCSSLMEVLEYRSKTHPDKVLYRFLSDKDENLSETLTYRELADRARLIASALQQENLRLGDRAILIYPPGFDLIAAFFGCLYAGVIAVPVYPPLNSYLVEKVQRVLENCQAKLLLTNVAVQNQLSKLKLLKKLSQTPFLNQVAKHYWPDKLELAQWDIEKISWLTTDNLSSKMSELYHTVSIGEDTLAFLQYTSGSTGHPKGVMISHGNLMHNMTLLHKQCGVNSTTMGASWLPPYHDMGLIGSILTPFFCGGSTVLMSPISFLSTPVKWLKAITTYRATVCSAPNFAYDYCARKIADKDKSTLDLSSWKVAINGAEPINIQTLERFYEAFKQCGLRKETLFPSYGLAEATLFVSGTHLKNNKNNFSVSSLKKNIVKITDDESDGKKLVSCGKPSQDLCIVDRESHLKCSPEEIGEIWIKGPSVAKGYWQLEKKTRHTFHAQIQGEFDDYMRTGDLGFLYQGELYITGRIKDLIIIHGANYYPQDFEETVNHADPFVRKGTSVAFSIEEDGSEKLVIVAEVDVKNDVSYSKVRENVINALVEQHEVPPYAIIFIKPKTLPKTTSGKLRRSTTKKLFEEKNLSVIDQWFQTDHQADTKDEALTPIQEKLVTMCVELFQRRISLDESFANLGVDSLLATQILSRIRDQFDIEVSIHSLFECKNLRDLSILITNLERDQKNG